MDEPSEEHDPQEPGEDKLDDRHEKPPLDQLTQPGDKETAQRRDHIPGRTLSCHEKTLQRFPRRDKWFFPKANDSPCAKAVVDSTRVTRSGLSRSCGTASISGLLLTAEAIITEAPEKEKGGGGMLGAGMGEMGGTGGMDY
jgi:hypothetical protein